jgi:hypothetical protein
MAIKRAIFYVRILKIKLRIGYFLLKIVRLYLITMRLRILIFQKIDKSVLKELGYQGMQIGNSATCDNCKLFILAYVGLLQNKPAVETYHSL